MSRMERLAAWCRKHVLAVDMMTSSIIFLISLATGWFFGGNVLVCDAGLLFTINRPMNVFWTCIMVVPLAARRSKPEISTLAFVALVICQLVLGPTITVSDYLSLVMLYTVIVYGNPRHSKVYIAIALAMTVFASMNLSWTNQMGPWFKNPSMTNCFIGNSQGLSAGFSTLFLEFASYGLMTLICVLSTIVIAFWQRVRLSTIRMMHERNESLQAGQEEERRIATLAERARIARDMHDVVAHTLSIIIVQADGGRYAGARNPQLAQETMETIRHESERALHDMNHVLGVFGGSSHANLDDLDSLISQAKSVSMDNIITYEVQGQTHPHAISSQTSTTSYRLVQEALTNIRKYAGSNVTVDIREHWTPDSFEISVKDNGRGASANLDGHTPGFGLIGMRERVSAAHGDLWTGPVPGGGFIVKASFPIATEVTGDNAYAQEGPIESREHTAPSDKAIHGGIVTGYGGIAENGNFTRNDTVAQGSTVIRDSMVAQGHTVGENGPISHHDGRGDAYFDSGEDHNGQQSPSSMQQVHINAPLTNPLRKAFAGFSHMNMQSDTLDQTGPHPSFNWIEKSSQWAQNHYCSVDIMCTIACLVLMLTLQGIWVIDVTTVMAGRSFRMQHFIVSTLLVLPMAVRRKLPEFSAYSFAVLAFLQLILMHDRLLVADLLALFAIYSVTMYGRKESRPWTVGFIMLDSLTTGVIFWLTNPERPGPVLLFSITAVVCILCFGTMALSLWIRSMGPNALVLQARQEAIQMERDKERTLAANLERERISANIQTEVTDTLTTVIDQTANGLEIIKQAAQEGRHLSEETIVGLFESIANRGRSALSRMRQLLTILRQTGFSDGQSGSTGNQTIQLIPASPMDQQLEALKQRQSGSQPHSDYHRLN